MPPINGIDLTLSIRTSTGTPDTYTILGAQRGATLEETTSEIDTASKDSRNATYLPGRYGATITCDALYVPSNTAKAAIQTAMRGGTTLRVRKTALGAEVVEQADCIVTSISSEFPDQDAATLSLTLLVTGAWGPLVN